MVSENTPNTPKCEPVLHRGAYDLDRCLLCRLFRAPTEAEIDRFGIDLFGICRDPISGLSALTCDIRDLSNLGAEREMERCQIARGKRLPKKRGSSFPQPPPKRVFVDLEHGAYHPRLCPKCSRFRPPDEKERRKYGATIKGVCEAGTRRMPVRYLIYDQREMSRKAVFKDHSRCSQIRHRERNRAKALDSYRLRRSEWLKRHKNWRKTKGHKGRSMSPKLRFEVLQRDGFRCVYCGRSAADVSLEVDHLAPIAEGGKTESDNLVTACQECNAGKKTLEIKKKPHGQSDR